MQIISKTRASGLSFRQVFDMVLEDLTLLSRILDDERERLSGDEDGVASVEDLEESLDGVYERMSELEQALGNA